MKRGRPYEVRARLRAWLSSRPPPHLSEVVAALGLTRAEITRAVWAARYLGRPLPHDDHLRAEGRRERYRWRGALHRFAPVGSPGHTVYWHACQFCGAATLTATRRPCRHCSAPSVRPSTWTPDPGPTPEDALAAAEAATQVRAAVRDLFDVNPRVAHVLCSRFGLTGRAETLDEIGMRLGVGRERVRQIEAVGLDWIRRKYITRETS